MSDSDLEHDLHLGGVDKIATLPRRDLERALHRLTTCHEHVFVVDQATSAVDDADTIVRIGVSERGAACLVEEFPEHYSHVQL